MDCFENSEELTDCLRRKKITCEHMHESFLELFEDAIGKNSAMKRSFENWLTKQPPTPEYINGPFTLTKHTYSVGQREEWTSDFCVYVFGEWHGVNNTCETLKSTQTMDIQNFLYEFAVKSPVFLDIFIEDDVVDMTKTENKTNNFMDLTTNMLKKISSYSDEKDRQNHPANVRIHAVDKRKIMESRIFGNYCAHIYNMDFDVENFDSAKKARDFIDKIYNDIEIIENIGKNPDKFISSFITTNYHINKELSRLKKEDREKIITFMVKRLSTLYSDIFPIIDTLMRNIMSWKNYLIYIDALPIEQKDEIIKNNDAIYDIYQNVCEIEIPFSSIFMDVYFMSRFLKGFRERKGNNKIHPRFPYNSIVYAGNMHADVYRKFFDELGFTSENLAREKLLKYADDKREQNLTTFENRCLHIDREKMYPMFGVSSCNQ
jgi:hypothetical protein